MGDVDLSKMKKQKLSKRIFLWVMGELTYLKNWLVVLWYRFINTRFFLGLVMLAIGISYTISYYEIQKVEFTEKIVIEDNSSMDVGVVGTPVAHASERAEIEEEEIKNNPSTPQTAKTDIENETNTVFGEDAKIALAIFKTESALNPKAQNWNCHYYDDDGKRYSTSCKAEDRKNAWSVDCGIAQINHITPTDNKECPAELFDPKQNIAIAKKMFDKRGFQPWVTYNMGYYKNNL